MQALFGAHFQSQPQLTRQAEITASLRWGERAFFTPSLGELGQLAPPQHRQQLLAELRWNAGRQKRGHQSHWKLSQPRVYAQNLHFAGVGDAQARLGLQRRGSMPHRLLQRAQCQRLQRSR